MKRRDGLVHLLSLVAVILLLLRDPHWTSWLIVAPFIVAAALIWVTEAIR